jgi:hypothetical protein
MGETNNDISPYREFLGGDLDQFVETARYRGEVDDQTEDGNGVIILFRTGGGLMTRKFPKKRVEAIGANFPTALVEFVIFACGATTLTKLIYVGKPKTELQKDLLEEPWDELSDEDVRLLNTDK